jgi:hypothetical protein
VRQLLTAQFMTGGKHEIFWDGLTNMSQHNALRVLDAETGKQLKTINVTEPGDLEAAVDGTIYVLSAGSQVLRLEQDGATAAIVGGLKNARIEVQVDEKNHRYTVEAAVPMNSLGLNLKPGLHLTGDIGVTHGDSAGEDTVLRTYWNNQKTGLIADEVFELKMKPRNWGQFVFE